MLQPHNGIFISTWYDDPEDTALFGLTPLLDELIKTRVKVPDILDKYRDQIPSWAGFDQYSQLGGVEYYDDPVGPDEGVSAPPPASYNPYGQAMQPPQGVDSAGGFRSDTSSVVAMRQEASPPSSPPNPPVGFTSPAIASSPHAASPTAQQTYLSPEPAVNLGLGAATMVASTGPAVSSSYVGNVGGYDSYPYVPQRSAPGGYPQVAKPQQAVPQQQPARPPAVRQAAPPAAQLAGQAVPHRTLAQATSPSSALAPSHAASPQRTAGPPARQVATEAAPAGAAVSQLQMRPQAPAFSAVSGPYQSAPPQTAQPPGAALWGRAGLGPHQAQPLRRR